MKKGFKTLITGICIFVIGGLVLPFLWILPLFQLDATANQFIVPGTQTFEAETPGNYYLWNDYQAVHEGISYMKSPDIPDGVEISATTAAGETLFFKTDSSISFSSGNSAKASIGYVEITEPTSVHMEVGGDFDERVFSFEPSMIMEFFVRIFSGIAVAGLLAAIGIGVGVWGVVKLLRKPA